MKIRNLLSMAVMMLLATVAYAGYQQPAPVMVDLVTMHAQGDQNTARTAADDVSFIGCGVRLYDDGVNPPSAWGFCQAGDSEENQITCFTQSSILLSIMGAVSDYSYITFNWDENEQCTFIGYSTQSFYLPNVTAKGKKKK